MTVQDKHRIGQDREMENRERTYGLKRLRLESTLPDYHQISLIHYRHVIDHEDSTYSSLAQTFLVCLLHH